MEEPIVFQKNPAPEDGKLADSGPRHYAVVLKPEGPWVAGSSNALWEMRQFAEDVSTTNKMDVLVVREDTHEAVLFYRAGDGLQEGWQEEDAEEAALRRRENYPL